MHELLLFSQIPYARHEQALHILAGVTGSRPVEIREQHLVYQQLKVADTNTSKRGAARPAVTQTQRPNYHRLIRSIPNSGEDSSPSIWRLRAEEVPEPGVKAAISRAASDVEVDETQLQKFRPDSEWYRFVKQYIIAGTRFISGNIIIRICQIILPFQSNTDSPVDSDVPKPEDLRPLDPSGTYFVEMCVRVEDGANSSLRDKAIDELSALKRTLEGAIDLRVPDRLALDTRIKAS